MAACDGQSTDYHDSTKWDVDNGVVKMGAMTASGPVFVPPSHWATLEIVAGKGRDEDDADDDEDKEKAS